MQQNACAKGQDRSRARSREGHTKSHVPSLKTVHALQKKIKIVESQS